MEEIGRDIIIGSHSIAEALSNAERDRKVLYGTDKGVSAFKSQYPAMKPILNDIEVRTMSEAEFHSEAQKIFLSLGHEYYKIPSHIYLLADSLPIFGPDWVFHLVKKGQGKFLALDQVTDVHNAGAILRTAAFFGIDAVVTGSKGIFGLTPSFFRIASGGVEHVKMVKCSGLSGFISKFQELGGRCLGFKEDAPKISKQSVKEDQSLCLVFGAEDKGLSHAVERVLQEFVSLDATGKIKTLNVSVAAAVAMEKFLGGA